MYYHKPVSHGNNVQSHRHDWPIDWTIQRPRNISLLDILCDERKNKLQFLGWWNSCADVLLLQNTLPCILQDTSLPSSGTASSLPFSLRPSKSKNWQNMSEIMWIGEIMEWKWRDKRIVHSETMKIVREWK